MADDGVCDGVEVAKVDTSDVLRFAGVLKVDAGVALFIGGASFGRSSARGAKAGTGGLSGKETADTAEVGCVQTSSRKLATPEAGTLCETTDLLGGEY